jgi:hypothetical protein
MALPQVWRAYPSSRLNVVTDGTGATRCKLTGQDLVPQTRRQPDIRPRVSLAQIDRPFHGRTSSPEVHHPSPWSSSLVGHR